MVRIFRQSGRIGQARLATLALLLVLACLTGILTGDLRHLWAGPRSTPATTAQITRPMTVEPPLAGEPAPTPAPTSEPNGTPCPIDPPTPLVSLSMRVRPTAAAGQEVEYRLLVENCSEANAHHVRVRNPLPAHARYVRAKPAPVSTDPQFVWELGTLGPCEAREIVLVLTPTGTGDISNCAHVQYEHGQCVTTKIARPEISLRKVGPKEAVLYDTMTYHLFISNVGGAEAANIVVTDTLPAGLEHPGGKNPLTWEIAKLEPGVQRHIEYNVIAKSAGKHRNEVVAGMAGGAAKKAFSEVVVGEAKLEVSKIVGPERTVVQLPVKYEINISNPGAVAARNVVITDILPPELTFVSASAGGKNQGNQVKWQVGTLPPGGKRSVQVVVKATAAKEIRNTVSVQDERGTTGSAEVTTTFEGGSGLTVGIVDSDDPLEAGKETSYVVTILNQGNVAATNLRLEALIPREMSFVRSEPAPTRQDTGRLIYQVPTLDAGMTSTFRIYVRAERTGDARFKIEFGCDQLPAGPVRREESTTIYADAPASRLEAPRGVP